jgi:hypothetical protein
MNLVLPWVLLVAVAADDIDAKIVRLAKPGTTADEVIRILGEPDEYAWGGKTFEKTALPDAYLMQYPAGIGIVISGKNVDELRSQTPGPGFTWQGKLRLGSSLEDVLQVLGPPRETLQGSPLGFAANVLYKDIKGKKGLCYYYRREKNVRCFFSDYKVGALYVLTGLDGPGKGSTTVEPIAVVKEYGDVRFKDLSKLDLSSRRELVATLSFNQKTIWPASMPPGVAPTRLLADAMNPGLGVRQLHREGLTGKGVNVAIIDQPLYQDHPEFAGKIAAYHDVGCESKWSMHGPAVASLLVGSRCGTAPDARLYYVAAPSWTRDTAYQARALDWIVEQNAKLPQQQKIRVVSVSAAPSGRGSPFTKNNQTWDPACQRAEEAGILVLDCTTHHGFIGTCYFDPRDPEHVAKCMPGFPGTSGGFTGRDLLVPCSLRTTAEEQNKGDCGYAYWGRGGLSWSIPYCAGVLALGWQARPELSGPQLRELLFKSAYKLADGSLIINPPAFIERVKALSR